MENNLSTSAGLTEQLQKAPDLFIKQEKEMMEIAIGFEASNKYKVMNAEQQTIGYIAEQSKGFAATITRMFLKSHRPLTVEVHDRVSGQKMFDFGRKFFFFFSDLWVKSNGQPVGSVHRRFGIIYKKYDLKDGHGQIFATVKSPLWRLWTFPIFVGGQQVGEVSKKWGGALREIFTDADTFRINFGQHPWSASQRAIIFAAAISIDFDFFEDNSNDGGILSAFG